VGQGENFILKMRRNRMLKWARWGKWERNKKRLYPAKAQRRREKMNFYKNKYR